ncbi:PrpF domain-containing protein [uncultured Thiodictyon sp.]|uniref:PrpF domain-containing protein n=1 Tax=uncultured Thiodictyon sp. TaxID=1846217 RepID=UPI0025FBC399|nr:PrpF domain-containing protein [uncultured Thiodictyon sp.]
MSRFDTNNEQMIFPVTIIRGGTSRGLFFLADEIPEMGHGQEQFLAAVMGKPDPLEVDGLGGGQFWNSKVAIVGRSRRGDADIDYTFVQVEPLTDTLDYNSNCGNVSAGVPLFALDRGLMTLPDGQHEVRIWNTNTQKLLYAELTIKNNQALVAGDYVISGIPGSGSKIFMDFRDTVGAATGKMFPTGRVKDRVVMEDGTEVFVTICDVSNIVVYVHASAVGCSGQETLNELNARHALFDRCAEIRGKAAMLAGLVDRWQDAREWFLPPVCMVTGPETYTASDGTVIGREQCALIGKLVVARGMHPTFMGTGSCCFAAAAAVPGTIANDLLRDRDVGPTFVFGHPGGVMPMEVDVVLNDQCNRISFKRLGFGRTARKIAECSVYVRPAVMENLKVSVVLPESKIGLPGQAACS